LIFAIREHIAFKVWSKESLEICKVGNHCKRIAWVLFRVRYKPTAKQTCIKIVQKVKPKLDN